MNGVSLPNILADLRSTITYVLNLNGNLQENLYYLGQKVEPLQTRGTHIPQLLSVST